MQNEGNSNCKVQIEKFKMKENLAGMNVVVSSRVSVVILTFAFCNFNFAISLR
jgi:hypothetical protein